VRRILDMGPTCYAVHRTVAEFIFEHAQPGSATLEIGLGVSTLVFALRGTRHVSITPFATEIDEIRKYAGNLGIPLAGVDFVAESSDVYLPRCVHREPAVALIP